jgi:hypothetical protein
MALMERGLDDTRVDREQRRSWPEIFVVACSSRTARTRVYNMSRILLHQSDSVMSVAVDAERPEVQAARGKQDSARGKNVTAGTAHLQAHRYGCRWSRGIQSRPIERHARRGWSFVQWSLRSMFRSGRRRSRDNDGYQVRVTTGGMS